MIGTVDLIVMITVVVSVIFALYRGLLRELLGISSWILAAFGAIWGYDILLKFFENRVEKVQIWTIICTILIALIILVVMTIINAHINGKLRKSSLSGLDRILGIIFGVVRAGLLIVLVWVFARHMMIPEAKQQELMQENKSISYMNQGADFAEKLLPESIQKGIKAPQKTLPKKQPLYSDKDREKLDEMLQSIVEVDIDE